MRTNDIRTTAESNAVVNHFFPIHCIVVNHAAPAAVQDDEQALIYVWREIMCAGHHWNIDFLNTPQGNVYSLNPCLLHHYFDNGFISFEELKKSAYVDEYQNITALPDTGKELVNMVNLCGVYPA